MHHVKDADRTPVGPLDEQTHGLAAELGAAAIALLHAGAVDVYLADESNGYACAASMTRDATLAPGDRLGADVIGMVAPHGVTVTTIDDVSALDGPLAIEARRLGAASLLLVRADKGQRALGALLCAYTSPRTFTGADEAAAGALARMAATSLDEVRRTNDALDRADRLASLLDSASAFAGELDLEALFATIHDQVRRHMDAPVFAVALQQTEGGQLRAEYMVDSGVRLNIDAVPPASGVVTEVFESGRPMVLESSDDGGRPLGGPADRHIESALFVPMRVRDQTIGVMVAQSYLPNAYEKEQIQLLLEVAEQAAVAIQNAGMVRDERRRMNELAVLHRLAALTNSEQSFDRIMTAIVNEAAAIFRADAVSIALENEHGDFRLAASFGMSDGYQRNRTIAGAVLRSLYGVPPTEQYLGPEQLPTISQEIVASEGVTNWFLVPLLHQSRLVGGLALGGRERSVRLSASETRLAQLFAEHAAAAMLRAQSAHALTERIEDYDLLTRVGHGLVSRLDVDYDTILRLLHEQLGYTHLAILTLDGDPPAITLKAHLGHAPHVDAMTFGLGKGVVGSVAASGEMLYLPDVSKDARYIPSTDDVQSEIAYPLKYGGQVLGVLDVQSATRDAFTARDRRILAALADQCAIALSNARQFATAGARLESLAATRAQLEQYAKFLEDRQDELRLVNAVSAAASATLDLDRILASAVRSVAEGLRADRCGIGILDEDQTRIEVAAEHRTDGRETSIGVRLPVAATSVMTDVISHRRTITSNDVLTDARFADVRSELAQTHVRGTVIVPLVAGGRVIGTLSVSSSEQPRRFTDDEIGVLETVANQLALGVRNARLYGRAKERANEDSLTGLFNHRYLHERLEYELLRARRANHPLAIALFDLNNFKMFNDTFGHLAGDEVLRVVATTLGMCLRGTDIAGRYGGDEFLVILPQADAPGARMLLDRVRRKLEEQAKAGFPPVAIELAAGVAVFPRDGQNKRDLIAHADQSMYAEKRIHPNLTAVGD